jgi:predicted nuclease of restriction endonuclease-like (RecB) superfamily
MSPNKKPATIPSAGRVGKSIKKIKTISPAARGNYPGLLADIKQRIRAAQVRAAMAGNAHMLLLYWEIGRELAKRQQQEGWGAAVLPRLAADLRNELPDVKGFSSRNLKRMVQFFREYPSLFAIGPRPVAQLQNLPPQKAKGQPSVALLPAESAAAPIGPRAVAQLPWAHNVILIQKVKDLPARLWYAEQAFAHGWSRDVLSLQIQSRARQRHGQAVTNFQQTLPPPQSDLAAQLLKDPYFFDFLTLEKPFHERELETGLLLHLQAFLVELGTGFAFVGRQVRLEVGEDDYYIDLLFYHLKLRAFVVIDLKVGPFKAEYAGKMNFYLNAVDDRMKHASDQPSIGLILCEEKNKIVAEYALRGMDKAIGVSNYQLTRALPKTLRSALPSIKQLEKELSQTKSFNTAKRKAGAQLDKTSPP